MDKDEIKHEHVIKDFLCVLNKDNNSNYILKGGTALRQCYGLDRFSEDIDLDAIRQGNLKSVLDKFCTNNGFSYTIKKDTPTVQRYMLDYQGEKNLKIEISFRRQNISANRYDTINQIKVYTLDELAQMKAMAYSGRDKIRDLYDLSFICDCHFDQLSSATKSMLQTAISYKGIEQFDYIIATQKDPLIDNDKLIYKFLQMHDKLDLLIDSKDIQIIENSKIGSVLQKEKSQLCQQKMNANQLYQFYLEKTGGVFIQGETDQKIYLQLCENGYERAKIADVLMQSPALYGHSNARAESMTLAVKFEKLPEAIKIRSQNRGLER